MENSALPPQREKSSKKKRKVDKSLSPNSSSIPNPPLKVDGHKYYDESDDPCDDERITVPGLREFFKGDLFDSRWLSDDQLKSLEQKWIKVEERKEAFNLIEKQFEAILMQYGSR